MSASANDRSELGPWKGRVVLSIGRALYLGQAGDTTPHAHHAVQLSIGLNGPLRLRHSGGAWRSYDGVLVSSDVSHQLDGGGYDLVLVYVEPESSHGRRLLEALRGPIRSVSSSTVSAVRTAARRMVSRPDTSLDLVFDEMMESVGSAPAAAAPTDPRVEQAVRLLRSQPETRASISHLARSVGLSPSRLRHLFRCEIGMNAQSYVLWLRINEACAAVAKGASLSGAAYQAGFSDAAHFTRTFRRTFGLAPSQVADRLEAE